VKFVLNAAYAPVDQLAPLARACDAAGFEAMALSDHLFHPRSLATPYPYTADGAPRWEPFTDWPDPWVTIGALAAVTERLRFVTSVFVLPLRSPVQVAKTVATASALSAGRVVLGVGVGWMREEFDALGQPFAARGRRTDEMIAVMRRLWEEEGWVEHHGEFFDFGPLEMRPAPPSPVPIWVGGLSERALRRAARLGDGWISDVHATDEMAATVARLRELRADSARADRPFSVLGAATDAYTIEGYRRLEEAGVTHAQTLPWTLYRSRGETLEERLDGIARFGDDVIAKMGAPVD
jgi:probable F420-dependent oxidoreductase